VARATTVRLQQAKKLDEPAPEAYTSAPALTGSEDPHAPRAPSDAAAALVAAGVAFGPQFKSDDRRGLDVGELRVGL
jgi:hypothetical protein